VTKNITKIGNSFWEGDTPHDVRGDGEAKYKGTRTIARKEMKKTLTFEAFIHQ
jgi:hypothetical protein